MWVTKSVLALDAPDRAVSEEKQLTYADATKFP